MSLFIPIWLFVILCIMATPFALYVLILLVGIIITTTEDAIYDIKENIKQRKLRKNK